MKKIIIFTIIILAIPTILVKQKENKNEIKYGIKSNQTIRVKCVSSGEIMNVPLEEYVKGVVAGEMPATFDLEALKAQAVASRTYVLKKVQEQKEEYDVTNDTSYQVYLTEEEIKSKYNDKYEDYIKKIDDAVFKTKGEVVLYDNNLIDAMFFSTSNGYTEDSKDVFQSQLPYLRSVESKWDQEESPVFNSSNEISKKEFLTNLGLDINNEIVINNAEKTKTGRVKTITINNKNYKSSEIRKIFGLRSTSFDIKIEQDKVIFNVVGFGHGVGLSQYGANGMAKKGYNYKEILKYYYYDCKIKKIN